MLAFLENSIRIIRNSSIPLNSGNETEIKIHQNGTITKSNSNNSKG